MIYFVIFRTYEAISTKKANKTPLFQVVLANELGMSYNSICLVTDTDCWKENAVHVSAELVIQRFNQFSRTVVDVIHSSILKIKDYDWEPMLRRREVKFWHKLNPTAGIGSLACFLTRA